MTAGHFKVIFHLTIKAPFVSILRSRVFLHDFTPERGVFRSGGHVSGSPPGRPEVAARKVSAGEAEIQRFQRQHKAAVLCEEARARPGSRPRAQRRSVQYDSHDTSKQSQRFFLLLSFLLSCQILAKGNLIDSGILTSRPQAQGRLEDQRSRAPGPMDDDDFFSLLLRVQGGRMDEQRTELPCMLQT